MTVYYAAVDGDPLTSEEGSYVIAQGRTRRIADESGRLRGGAVIGDFAFLHSLREHRRNYLWCPSNTGP